MQYRTIITSFLKKSNNKNHTDQNIFHRPIYEHQNRSEYKRAMVNETT